MVKGYKHYKNVETASFIIPQMTYTDQDGIVRILGEVECKFIPTEKVQYAREADVHILKEFLK